MLLSFLKKQNSYRRITLKKLSEVIGAELPEAINGGAVCGKILTQSEYVTEGDVVISAGWYPHDKTVSAALERGALAIFCPEAVKKRLFAAEDNVIGVSDPMQCVKAFELWRTAGCNAKRIAISGSVGKTTTTGLIDTVIAGSYKTLTHYSMSNSHGAILRNIQKLTPSHEWWVQEVGGVQPEYVESSACVLRPDITVLTNIGQSHLDNYITRENILYDKCSLERYLKPNGTVVINSDDEMLRNAAFTHRCVTVSMRDSGSDYYITAVRTVQDGIEFDFSCAEGSFTAHLRLYGDYNAYNGAMAIAVGRLAGVSMRRCIELVGQYTPNGMRQNYRNIGGYHMLVDCFNAEPRTVLGSAKTLSRMPRSSGGRRIFVTGHIDKLGQRSKQMHYELGRELAKLDIDLVVLYGGDSDRLYAGLIAGGFENAVLLKTRKELDDWIRQNITRNDITFYKSGQFETALAKTIDHVYGTRFQNDQQFNEGQRVELGDFRFRVRRDGIAELERYTGSAKNVVIPAKCGDASVIRIRDRAFKYNLAVTSVSMPDTVVNIGKQAFYRCVKLRSVKLPSSLKYIGESAFAGCRALTELSIPSGTIHIEKCAFSGCRRLAMPSLPASVGFVGENAFDGQ